MQHRPQDTSGYKLVQFVLSSRIKYTAIAMLLSIIPFFNWLSVLILGLVTLRKGVWEGLRLMLWIVLPAVIVNAMYFPWYAALLNFFIGYTILWAMASTLRMSISWRFMLEASCFVSIVGVVVIQLVFPDLDKYYITLMTDLYQRVNGGDVAAQKDIIASIKPYLKYVTGLQVVIVLLGNLVNLVVARSIQSYMYNPGGVRKELLGIQMSQYAALGVIIAVVFAFILKWSWVYAIIPIISLLPFVAGLSLVHFFASVHNYHILYMLVFYILLIVFSPYSFIPLALLGLVDARLNLRKKIPGKNLSLL